MIKSKKVLLCIIKCYIFVIESITRAIMQQSTTKIQTAFRLDSELLRRLKIRAREENRSLNNYVETILKNRLPEDPDESPEDSR